MELQNHDKIASIHKEKFGHVYIRTKTGEYELAEGAQFSNTKLRIFNGKSEDKACVGGKYSFGVQGKRLNVPIPLGKNTAANLENLGAAYYNENEIIKQLNLFTDTENPEIYKGKCQLISDLKMCLFWALASPDMDILQQNFLTSIGPFAYIHILMETFGSIPSDEGTQRFRLPYKFTNRVSRILSQALRLSPDDNLRNREMHLDESALPEILLIEEGSDENLYGQFIEATNDKAMHIYGWINFVLKFVSVVWNGAVETGVQTGCSPTSFLKHVTEIMETFCFEISHEWHATSPECDADITMLSTTLSKGTGVAILALESILLQNGIHLGEEIRESTLFKLILDQFKSHFQNVNTFFAAKEKMQGVTDEGMSCDVGVWHNTMDTTDEDPQRKIVEDANHALEQVERLSNIFIGLWKGTDKERVVVKFVKTIQEVLTGHMQWYSVVQNYHYEPVVDCYMG